MVKYLYDWKNNLDRELILDLNWFLRKVNERACIAYGYMNHKYEPVNRFGEHDYGLEFDVEYFHPSITLDDRMRFIIQSISTLDTSVNNILGNTLISHFYGGRGVHFIMSGKQGEFVDFDRAHTDEDYIQFLRSNADKGKAQGKPIWGTTELHTSIQTAGRNYCREKYNDPQRVFHPVDVIQWVASFKENGLLDELLQAEHIKEAYTALRKLRGIGEYYGFHGAASSSVLPHVKYHHDQRFVAPGPGAVYAINRIWPDAPKKLYPEAVYFIREKAEEIGVSEGVIFHPETHNLNEAFLYPQDSLKYYGTEVMCCQFGIYLQIRNDPKACARRKVARVEEAETSLEDLFS